MKFSVLMSVYVKEKPEYLKEALESILTQTLLPNEIVIVKDGPLTKELDVVLSEYEKKNPKLFKLVSFKKNMGLGNALNEGLKHCSYEYVARADSDDVNAPTRFEEQIKYLESHPNCDVLGTAIEEFDEFTGKAISKKIPPVTKSEIATYIKKRNPLNHMTVFFRKNAVEKAGGYIDCLYFEDYYLWARIFANNGSLHNIKRVLVNARSGEGQISRRGGIEYVKAILNFENKLKKLNITSTVEYVYSVIGRISIALLPNKLRLQFYKKKLRNK